MKRGLQSIKRSKEEVERMGCRVIIWSRQDTTRNQFLSMSTSQMYCRLQRPLSEAKRAKTKGKNGGLCQPTLSAHFERRQNQGLLALPGVLKSQLTLDEVAVVTTSHPQIVYLNCTFQFDVKSRWNWGIAEKRAEINSTGHFHLTILEDCLH